MLNLKSKTSTTIFALLALIFGFLFLNHSATGNVVLNDKQPFTILSIVGLSLIACAIILAFYSIRKK